MHFCQDEAYAFMATLPFLLPAWLWLKKKLSKKAH